jgi:hypothetical protein
VHFEIWTDRKTQEEERTKAAAQALVDASASNVAALASSSVRVLLSSLPPTHSLFKRIADMLAEAQTQFPPSTPPLHIEFLLPMHPIRVVVQAELDELEAVVVDSQMSGEEHKPNILASLRSRVWNLQSLFSSKEVELPTEQLHSTPNVTSLLTFGSLNIRGKALSNSKELCDLLKLKKVDIIGLQEVLTSIVVVPGFKWFPGLKRSPRSRRNEGTTNQGMGFLVRSETKTLVSVVNIDPLYEIMWIKVAAKGITNDTYVASVYAPGENYPISNREAFFSCLSEQCLQYSAKGDIILLGDFNAHLGTLTGDTTEESSNGRLLKSLLQLAFNNGENGAYPSILNTRPDAFGVPTRQKGSKSSILDYIICSVPSLSRVNLFHIESQSQKDGANACGSDHHLLLLKWKQNVVPSSKINQAPRFAWDTTVLLNEVCKKEYQAALADRFTSYNALVDPVLSSPHLITLPYALRQSLQDTISAIFNHQITLTIAKVVSARKVSANSKPFWNESLRDLQNLRTAAHSKMRNF